MKYLYIGLSFLFSLNIIAQEKNKMAVKYANTITQVELSKHLQILASDEYEGRETGKEGQKMAMRYLVENFKSTGLAPGTKDYIQSFPLIEQMAKGIDITVDGKKFNFVEDFFIFPSILYQQKINTQIVFAGYGIEDENFNDYKNINVADKIVLLVEGSPKKENLNEDWDIVKKIELAKKKGAKAVFLAVKDYDGMVKKYDHYINRSKTDLKSEIDSAGFLPVFRISNNFASYISKSAGLKLKKYVRKERIKDQYQTTIELNIDKPSEELYGENVLGFIKGSKYPEQLVIITAHYDHLGKDGEVVFNGADDDGSGTVALLEMAEAFKLAEKDGNGPLRSILFMPVSGEEKGFLGSQYYSENPVFPLNTTVANLNIDMIGRVDEAHEGNPNYIYLIGSDKLSTQLHKISEQANKIYTQLELDYTFNDKNDPNRFYYRSDHYNFAKNDIPVIFYFSGVHEDYHKATDTVDKINFEKMEKITKLVFFTAWELVNREDPIKVDVHKE